MLIICKTNQINNLYSIWNTVTDLFEVVEVEKEEAIKFYQEYRETTYEDAKDMVDNYTDFKYLTQFIGIKDKK